MRANTGKSEQLPEIDPTCGIDRRERPPRGEGFPCRCLRAVAAGASVAIQGAERLLTAFPVLEFTGIALLLVFLII